MAATDVVIADVSNLKLDADEKKAQLNEEENQEKSNQSFDIKQKEKLDKMLGKTYHYYLCLFIVQDCAHNVIYLLNLYFGKNNRERLKKKRWTNELVKRG